LLRYRLVPQQKGACPVSEILQFIRPFDVFDGETLTVLGEAYDKAKIALHNSGQSCIARESVAIRLFELASKGERDPESLLRGALSSVGLSIVSDRVKDIIAKHLGIDRDKVTEDANFIDDLGADSIDTVELAMSFEEKFGCEIPDEVADSMFTVGDVIKFLETTARVDISRLAATAR
jgi:acyl carrier protein